jgi:cobalt/nickel transport system permease protein
LSFAYLVFGTTRFNEITLALTRFKLPKIFVEIIDMTYRYIFLIAKIALQMSEARYLRSVGNIKHRENRRFIGYMIAGIFIKSIFIAKEVHFAMLLRGYQGSYTRLQQLKYKLSDYVFLLSNGLIIMILIYLSRI